MIEEITDEFPSLGSSCSLHYEAQNPEHMQKNVLPVLGVVFIGLLGQTNCIEQSIS
jgi:hypothetical protein